MDDCSPKGIIEKSKDDLRKLDKAIRDPNQFPDDLLFQICQSGYAQSSKSEQKVIEMAFWELIGRYQKIINALCHITRKKKQSEFGDPSVDDFYVYVQETLWKKLQNGDFFGNFLPYDNFSASFQKTLSLYITRYFWLEYNRKSGEKTISLDNLPEVETRISEEEECDENRVRDIYNSLVQKIYQSLEKLKLTKEKVFEFLIQVPTRSVREFVTDEKIHTVTRVGQIDLERNFARTQEILEQACGENEERLCEAFWKEEKGNLMRQNIQLYNKKIKLLERMLSLQKENLEENLAEMEKLQKNYCVKDRKSLKLQKEINQFLQLSYSTIALVLNTTLDYCYRIRRDLKQKMKDSRTKWASESEGGV